MDARPVQQAEQVTVHAVERVASRLPQGLQPPTPEAGPRLPPLDIGQVVSATVVDQLAGGRYRLALEGVIVEAMAHAGLRPGAELSLRVSQVKPDVTLHLLPLPQGLEADAIHLLRTLLPHATPVGDSLSQLQQELSRAMAHHRREEVPRTLVVLQDFLTRLLPEEAPPTAERLHAFVRDGGLHYETKLSQLVTPQS